MMHTVVDFLNEQVANWQVMAVKLQNYHWLVKGEQFFILHDKFEELYKEAAGNTDELAERVLALEGIPVATMKDYLQKASIHEAAGSETSREMIGTLAADYSRMAEQLKKGICIAQDAGDETTADLFIEKIGELEKHVWMLQAYLA